MNGQKEITDLNQAQLHEADEKIRDAWKVILSLQREIQIARSKGIKGRIAVHRGKQKWKKYGVFESTEQTKRALAAYREGRTLEMDFGKEPDEVEGHNAPKDHLIESKHAKKAREAKSNEKGETGRKSDTDEKLIDAAKEEEETQPENVVKGEAPLAQRPSIAT